MLALLDLGLLSAAEAAEADVETAIATAELSDLELVAFPRSPAARSRLRERLSRARAHLLAALENNPANRHAALLIGVLAALEGDDADAAPRLEGAARWLSESGVFAGLLPSRFSFIRGFVG